MAFGFRKPSRGVHAGERNHNPLTSVAKMNESRSKTAKMRVPMDATLQAHLGDQLRQLFAETANQPIPRRLATLLDRLEAGDAAASAPQDPQSRPSIEVNI